MDLSEMGSWTERKRSEDLAMIISPAVLL